MQAAAEQLIDRGAGTSLPWWESAPFSGSPGVEVSNSGSSSTGPSSFAGVLSALTAPRQNQDDGLLAWRDDGLADDLATLSYERALRAQAKFEPVGAPFAAAEPPPIANARNAPGAVAETEVSAEEDRNQRSASITFRLSYAECAQLKQRAAEAGLTMSAYLRSCTFEAEALRAQVKKALAALRTASPEEKRPAPAEEAQTPRRWWQLRPHADSHSIQF